jgi:hypothetical protein
MPPAGFEPHNPSKQTAADPRLKQRGHRDGPRCTLRIFNSSSAAGFGEQYGCERIETATV